MVKQPTAEQTEFQMQSEDFPALPGTQPNDGSAQQMNMNHNIGSNTASIGNSGDGVLDLSNGSRDHENESSAAQDKALKRGVQTSPDGSRHACHIYASLSEKKEKNGKKIQIFFLLFEIRRPRYEYSGQYGEQSIWHGWSSYIHSSGRIESKSGDACNGTRFNWSRIEFEFTRESVSNLWWPILRSTLPVRNELLLAIIFF